VGLKDRFAESPQACLPRMIIGRTKPATLAIYCVLGGVSERKPATETRTRIISGLVNSFRVSRAEVADLAGISLPGAGNVLRRFQADQ
jgi:hypothetical protein